MMVTLQLRQLKIPPGQRILLTDVCWLEFEAILEELGVKRASRIAYHHNTLEIRMPLPQHEFDCQFSDYRRNFSVYHHESYRWLKFYLKGFSQMGQRKQIK